MQTMEMEQIITTEKPFILETPEGIFRVKKAYDDGTESPREWDGNLATMTCWHRQYALGDKHEFEDPTRRRGAEIAVGHVGRQAVRRGLNDKERWAEYNV